MKFILRMNPTEKTSFLFLLDFPNKLKTKEFFVDFFKG